MEIIVYLFKVVKFEFDYGGYSDGNVLVVVVLFSVFDKVNYDEYIFYVYVFYLLVLFNVVFEVVFVKVLVEYCEWVGWFGVEVSGNFVIVFNDVGVWFVEVMVDVEFGGSIVVLLSMGGKVLSCFYLSCDGVEELLLV